MQSPLLKTVSGLSNKLSLSIQNNDYLSDAELSEFSQFMKYKLQCTHQIGLLLSKGARDRYHLNVQLLLDSIGLGPLTERFGSVLNNLDLRVSETSLYMGIKDTNFQQDMPFRNLIGAYSFFCIAQAKGNFIQYMSEQAQLDLSAESIIKVPNPHLQSYFQKNQSIRDTNIYVAIAFALIALAVNPSLADDLKAPQVDFDLVPTQVELHGSTICNCSVLAKLNNSKLAMAQIDRPTYEAHRNAFTQTQGYDGYDVDDWMYFRFYEGAINSGMCEAKYAISPSLGIMRGINIGEYYNLNSFSA